jgi:hypothetical protein
VQIPDNSVFHFTGNVTYQIKVKICADITYYYTFVALMINCIDPDSWGFNMGISDSRFAYCSCIINGTQYNCISPDVIPADNEFHTITGVRKSTSSTCTLMGF